MIDCYKTPAGPARAVLYEKRSEFIAQLAPAAGETDALAFLEKVRAEHRTASHNVFAYRLRQDARCRHSDDGEPAKTAGLPVLSAIEHAGLFDVIIVVTRYFGGTLLGTGGLVRAYAGAAGRVIGEADIATVRRLLRLRLALPYARYEPALRLLSAHGARLEGDAAFADDVRLTAVLPEETAPGLADALRELLHGDVGFSFSSAFYAAF